MLLKAYITMSIFIWYPARIRFIRGRNVFCPGEYLFYRKGHVETRKYWQMQFLENEKRPFQELKQDFLSVYALKRARCGRAISKLALS